MGFLNSFFVSPVALAENAHKEAIALQTVPARARYGNAFFWLLLAFHLLTSKDTCAGRECGNNGCGINQENGDP